MYETYNNNHENKVFFIIVSIIESTVFIGAESCAGETSGFN